MTGEITMNRIINHIKNEAAGYLAVAGLVLCALYRIINNIPFWS